MKRIFTILCALALVMAGSATALAAEPEAGQSASYYPVSVEEYTYIPWRQSGFYIVCALIGSGLGANLALAMDDTAFKCIMLIILPVTAIHILRACLKTFDKNGGVGDNRKKQAGAGENASIPK